MPVICPILVHMPKKSKKLLITTETHEIVRIRRSGSTGPWLTVSETGAASGISEREVYRMAENREIPFHQSEDGHLFVCHSGLQTALNIAKDSKEGV